jgi:1,4-alpha-glucan branching enzyme
MPQFPVHFTFHAGVGRPLFQNVRLVGSWDSDGRYSETWSAVDMTELRDESGCPAFEAAVSLDAAQQGRLFRWGVMADTPGTPNRWVIATEIPDANTAERHRAFTLTAADQQERYWFATGRRFGAQKLYVENQTEPAIRFSVWAPNARKVEVVFAAHAAPLNGYIADDGDGIDLTVGEDGAFPLTSIVAGIWQTDLPRFEDYFERPYMFRITNEQGQVTYKTDIYSRNQAGHGRTDPGGAHFAGTFAELNGTVSCSMVADPDRVTRNFEDTGLEKRTLIAAEEFWTTEFTAGRIPPQRIEDLVIYELHVGSLGFGSTEPGNFADALAFVPKLVELGVNAVELLPVLEFDGDRQWGYGTSHFFCLQTSAGGANQLKHFVRACHRQGIAVILDVVYNHFSTSHGERSEWGYDSDPNQSPEHNIYNWYQGNSSDYANPDGGYVDNNSSGYAPRYWEENVRQMFSSSAAMLLDEFHVDGFRVDLTGAIHQDNRLHANGNPVSAANLFGIKLLRELARTVKIVNPNAFLIAEDHTGWSAMTQSPNDGGIGFDALWYADFYHHLAGDGDYGDDYAKLLKTAGFGGGGPLRMDYFTGALQATQYGKIAYHESHDEAGNGRNTERTIVTAVNGASLAGETRRYAEGRCRFAFGMAALSAGTPMFLMGEEIGAAKYFKFDSFYLNKEDLIGERTGNGRFLFRFYQDLNRLSTTRPSLRSRNINVLHSHNENRVIAFLRSAGAEQTLVIASLSDRAFQFGYDIPAPEGGYKEVFNSDSHWYGGDNVGNDSATLPAMNGQITVILPAHGFVVLQKVS